MVRCSKRSHADLPLLHPKAHAFTTHVICTLLRNSSQVDTGGLMPSFIRFRLSDAINYRSVARSLGPRHILDTCCNYARGSPGHILGLVHPFVSYMSCPAVASASGSSGKRCKTRSEKPVAGQHEYSTQAEDSIQKACTEMARCALTLGLLHDYLSGYMG